MTIKINDKEISEFGEECIIRTNYDLQYALLNIGDEQFEIYIKKEDIERFKGVFKNNA